ncbi:hypothetical protein GGF31_007992 [Allomyces arbusculus]|nr:hypothetical protein GGF31_007992 [Allomyces arbusculus]
MAKALPPLPPAHDDAINNAMPSPASTAFPLADSAPRTLSEITPASAASTTSTTSSNADQQLVPPRPGAPAPQLPTVAPCTTPPVGGGSHDSATAPPPLPSRRSSVILDPAALSLDTTTAPAPPTTAPPCLVYVPHHRRAHMVADVARVLATTPSSARAAHAARAVSWRPRYATGMYVDGKWTIYLTKENTTANLDAVAEKRIAVPEAWTSRIIPVPATTAFTEVNEGGSPPQSPLATAVFFADDDRDGGHEGPHEEEDDEMDKDHSARTPSPVPSPAVVPRSRTSTSSISPAATPPVAGRPRRGSLTAVLSGVASASRRASLVLAASAASAITGTSTSTSTQAALPAPPAAAAAAAQPHVTPSPALALVLSSDAAFLVDRPVRRSAAQRALLGSMPSPRAVRQVAGWLVGSSSSTTSSASAPATTATGRARAGSVDSVASSDEGSGAGPTAPIPAGAPSWTASASAQSFPLVLRFAEARDAHRFLESLQTRGAPAPSPIVPGSPRIARTPTLPRHARTASLSDVPPRRRSSLRDHAADAVAAVTAVWASLPRTGAAVEESETILARGRSGSIATLDEPPTQPSAFSHLVTTSSVPVSPTRSEASSSVWREPYVPRVRRPSAASTATTSTTASSTMDRPVSDTATELKLLHAALAQIQARHLGPKAAEMALAVADREDPTVPVTPVTPGLPLVGPVPGVEGVRARRAAKRPAPVPPAAQEPTVSVADEEDVIDAYFSVVSPCP